MPPIDLVNVLQGANSHFGFSQGNCLPITALPFGMTHWCPQTGDGSWFFDGRARKLQGVRATHQPSPWIGDYGPFLVAAQVGPPEPDRARRASAYRLERSVVRPDYLCADLLRYDVRLEVTPTERCAVFRFHFPATSQAQIILESAFGPSWIRIEPEHRRAVGFTRGSSGGTAGDFACYFVAKFDHPIQGGTTFVSGNDLHASTERAGEQVGAAVSFVTDGEPVEMRIATSFISIEQAEANLRSEIGDARFDTVRERARRTWEAALSRIEIEGGTEAQRRMFYSCIYRVHLFPRKWYEPAAPGQWFHHSPYDGEQHPGVLYADNGFWDTYRTVYPLLALLMPDALSEILEGWTQAYREGGWFPQWASPGYRACMVGTHIDAVMADAVVRGVRGFDVEAAYEGMRKHAFDAGDAAGSYGRIGIQDYLDRGYVAADRHSASVARSLDYAYDDFCIAQMAGALGKEEDRRLFLSRAKNYRHLYDPAVGFMRGRNADGSWAAFREFQWGDPYIEGGPWQSTWAVPHDPAGLIRLMGGREMAIEKLERMLTMPPRFEVGHYGFEIHEMTEMACTDFGQYAHSNQPVHHVLYLFTAAGRPDRTQYWVRRVLTELYTPEAFPGDEDNGEMSAWYILSALGLYPLCPGHPSWTLGAPLFDRALIRLPGDKELIIETDRSGEDQIYVQQVRVNGETHPRLWIDHATLAAGASLRFSMTSAPAYRASYHAEELPFSMTNGD